MGLRFAQNLDRERREFQKSIFPWHMTLFDLMDSAFLALT